jgi:hypothetical protein
VALIKINKMVGQPKTAAPALGRGGAPFIRLSTVAGLAFALLPACSDDVQL